MTVDGDCIRWMLANRIAQGARGEPVDLSGGLSEVSATRLQQIVHEYRPSFTLEVGCAMGVSTLAILYALSRPDGKFQTAIDPNQSAGGTYGWRGIGLAMVEKAGMGHLFECIEAPSYLALPDLLSKGRRFDLVFIDGWHSFDYVFADYFYSDLLLNAGGILVFDDVDRPQIDLVCQFLETHKQYERLRPRKHRPLNPAHRLVRKFRRYPHAEHLNWGSIQAYRKISATTVGWGYWQSTFYPYYNVYRWLM